MILVAKFALGDSVYKMPSYFLTATLDKANYWAKLDEILHVALIYDYTRVYWTVFLIFDLDAQINFTYLTPTPNIRKNCPVDSCIIINESGTQNFI